MGKVPDLSFAGKTREEAEAMLESLKKEGKIADYAIMKAGGVYRATIKPVKEEAAAK